MTTTLQHLIQQASTELGSTDCEDGRHQWVSNGGRACPHNLTDNCSQAAYECSVCGEFDYGEDGGPGEADCEKYCQHRVERAIAIIAKRIDPLGFEHHLSTGRSRSSVVCHMMLLRALRRQPKPRLP